MVLVIQCDPRVPSGIYGEYLREHRVSYRETRLFAGDALPSLERVTAALVLGGYMGVADTDEFPFLVDLKTWLKKAVDAGLPLLGICLGGQLLAEVAGGKVHSDRCGEQGLQTLSLTEAGEKDRLFSGISSPFTVFEWHHDSFEIPAGALLLASSSVCPGQAFRFGNAYGLQFHPEVNAAIVDEWAAAIGQPHLGAAFSSQANNLRRPSLRLLVNFLSRYSLL